MGESPEFREEIKAAVRRHDPDPTELRTVANWMSEQADYREQLDQSL